MQIGPFMHCKLSVGEWVKGGQRIKTIFIVLEQINIII